MKTIGSSLASDLGFHVLLIAFALVTVLPIGYRWLQGERDVFAPSVWLPSYMLLVFGVFNLPFIHGWLPVYRRLSPADYWLCQALAAVLLGALCMGIGDALARTKRRTVRPDRIQTDLEVKPEWVIALSGVGLGLQIYMLHKGYYGYLMVRSAYFDSLAESQLTAQLSVLSRFGFVLAAIDFFRHPRSSRRAVLFGSLLGVQLVLAVLSGMKGQLLIAGLLVALIYSCIRGRLPTRSLAIGTLAFLLFIPINQAYRDRINRGHVDRTDLGSVGETVTGLPSDLLEQRGAARMVTEGATDLSQRLALLPSIALTMRYVEKTGDFWHGKTYLLLPLQAFVPRFLWPGKPVSEMGYWFSYAVVGNPRHMHHGEAITTPGDLYLNFGWTGVCVGFFMLGLLLRLLYQWCIPRGDLSTLFLYASIWPSFMQLESDVLTSVAGALRVFLLLLVIRRFAFSRVAAEAGVRVDRSTPGAARVGRPFPAAHRLS